MVGHEADPFADGLLIFDDIAAEDAGFAVLRPEQGADDLQRGRFTRAVRADKSMQRMGLHLKRDMIQGPPAFERVDDIDHVNRGMPLPGRFGGGWLSYGFDAHDGTFQRIELREAEGC